MKEIIRLILANAYAIFSELKNLKLRRFPQYFAIEEFKTINTKKVCIFAIYEDKLIISIKKTFDELIRNKYQVIVVNSKKMNNPLREYVASHANVFIHTSNNGKDFGKYKAGYEYIIEKKLKNITSLLLINDSFYFLSKAHSMWRRVESSRVDVVSIIQSALHSNHLQSYFILFKKKSFLNKQVKEFFLNYKNYNARYYQIKFGELGLSKAIKRSKLKYSGIVNKDNVGEFLSKYDTNKIFPKKTKKFIAYQTNYTHSLYSSLIHNFDIPILKKDILKNSLDELNNIKILLKSLKISDNYTREITNTIKQKNLTVFGRKKNFIIIFLIKIGAF
jgi:hypothetical protein